MAKRTSGSRARNGQQGPKRKRGTNAGSGEARKSVRRGTLAEVLSWEDALAEVGRWDTPERESDALAARDETLDGA